MIQSEVFPAKLTINRIIENGVVEKTAVLEVGDRYGNRTEYDITDSDSIRELPLDRVFVTRAKEEK